MGAIRIYSTTFTTTPNTNQTITISHKVCGSLDSTYVEDSNSVVVLPNGNLQTPFTISGLADNTCYTVRFCNNCGGTCYTENVTTNTFDVLGIGDMAVWLDAARGITLSGGAVQTWNDISGNNNHFSAPSSSARPTVGTGIGIKPALIFDGIDDQLTGPALSNTSDYTIVIVGSAVIGRGIDSDNWSLIFPSPSDGYASAIVITNPSTNYLLNPHTFSSGESLKALTIEFDGSNTTYLGAYENGNYEGEVTQGNIHLKGAGGGGINIGRLFTNSFYDGKMSEVMIFTKVLTETQLTNLSNYLKAKYSIV